MDDFCGSEFWVRMPQITVNFGIFSSIFDMCKFLESNINLGHRESRTYKMFRSNSAGLDALCISLGICSIRNILHEKQ